MLNASQCIAIRFNFQKIAPLGIEDSDYRRIAMALDLWEDDVRIFCENCKTKTQKAADALRIQMPDVKNSARICFIGDSITSERTSYMRIAQSYFGNCDDIKMLDCAISGWKTSDMIFEYEERVIPFRPTIIHMLIGTNDARNAYPGEDRSTAAIENYRRNMGQLIRYGLDLGAKVIVTTLVPTKLALNALPNGNYPKWEIETFNSILREIAMIYPVVLNDMEAEMTQRLDEIIDDFDNLHINFEGQFTIAKRLIPILISAINQD